MLIQAPQATSLRIEILSANQVLIKWDDVGENFYYIVELASTRDGQGVTIPENELSWFQLGYTPAEQWFEDKVIYPNSFYKMRIQVSAPGFEVSEWTYTEEFQTFNENAYYVSAMKEFTPSAVFVREKFNKNKKYVDFNNDVIMASLMRDDFIFSPEMPDISNVADKIVTDENFHEIQDHVEPVCVDIDRVMLAEIDDVLYAFERFQPMAKVSNDKGQSWQYYKAFTDRVGNPVSRTCVYQSKTTTFVLGYDKIFYGRRALDSRWSADDVRFSNDSVTFAKIGDELNLGFDVELFNIYTRLPGGITKYAEAMTCNDEHLYVAAKDAVRRIKLNNAPVDTDPASPTFGEKIFEPEIYRVTNNQRAVVKKMDSLGGEIFALVTGEVKANLLDPTKKENVIPSVNSGVYRFNEAQGTFERVFGNTAEERRVIEHEYTNMSTNGTEIFISEANFKYPGTIDDEETVIKYDDVNAAVKYFKQPGYNSDIKIHFGTYRAHIDDTSIWRLGHQEYYNEANFTWMYRSGTRCWITHSNKPLVVYPKIVYSIVTDDEPFLSETRINKEIWNNGRVTLKMADVFFTGFKRYSNGILFHKNTGEIIGYYEFPYRVRDNVSIFWKPSNTMMVLELQNQVREEPWSPEHPYGLRDPDLRPLVTKMMPESYLNADSNFSSFSEYYLQFLSDGNGTYYNKLLNLIKNKYPREQYAYEYLWSEINKRNIYLDKNKRDQVVRFFESRASDFYSTKGIEESYKFLFKLLYNEEVEIDIESKQGIDYDIVIYSDNIDQDIVGRTVYTPTGRANVTYIEREYSEGKLQWRLTIHNMIGKFYEGQELKSERTAFKGTIIVGVRGKELASDTIDYINRNRSYYVMKIKSAMPASRYRQDVLRFVHPAGFGFIGITLLTIFINSGLSMKHVETIINILKAYRFDAGYPTMHYDRVGRLDVDGNMTFDLTTGEPLYDAGPQAGQPFVVPPEYDTEEATWLGKLPSQRRFNMSPLFDQSAVVFSHFRDLVERRLKDNIGNPRDPRVPTQVKINE